MNNQELLNALKQVATFVFALFVAKGYLTADQSTTLITNFAIIVPAFGAIGSVVWSIYSHWNMKKVPENSTAVIGLGAPPVGATVNLAPLNGLAKVVGCLLVCLLTTSAFAADVSPPIVTKAPPVPFAYPSADGWYGLIGTEGGGGTVSVSAPGVNANSLVSNTIAVYVGAGYAWNINNSPMFSALEGKVGIVNFNGSAPGLSWQGPLDFHVRWLIGAPIDQIVAFFPNLNIAVPTFSNLPAGFTAVSTKYYIAPGFHVSDDSLTFMGKSTKAWGFSPSITPAGLLVALKNGSVADFYSEVRLNDRGLCSSSPLGQACGRANIEVLAGLDYKFGIYGLSTK